MLPDTFKEFIDQELKKGFFDKDELNTSDNYKDYYTFNEVRKMCNEKYKGYINELKEKNRLKQRKKD